MSPKRPIARRTFVQLRTQQALRRAQLSMEQYLDDSGEKLMAGNRNSDPKTKAQRRFEELLRKTEAYLKKKASLETEAVKPMEPPKKDSKV